MEFDPHPVKMTVPDAMNFRRFNIRCAEAGIGLFRPLKKAAWNDMLNEAQSSAEKRQISMDETVEFQFRQMFYGYLYNRHRGTMIEDVLLDKAAHETDDTNRIYFTFAGLRKHADGFQRFKLMSDRVLGELLNGIGEWNVDVGKTTKRQLRKHDYTGDVRWVRHGLFGEAPVALPLPPIPMQPF